MEDYYEYLDSNGVTTLYKLIKDDTVALIDSYSVTLNGITTNLDNHVNNVDIHTPIADIEGMIDTAIGSLNFTTPDYVDTKVAGLVNSAPETLDILKELSDALGNDSNFATTVATQIGNKANDNDVVHKSGDETIDGAKKFTSDIVRKYTEVDITTTPTSDMYAHINFTDKNNKSVAYIQYAQKSNGVDYIGLRVQDKNSNTWGVQLNTNKEFMPLDDNSYSLGSPTNKWANVYASEIDTRYLIYNHKNGTSYSSLPKTSGTLAIQERTRGSAVRENLTLLYECTGGLAAGDITLNDAYSRFNALLIVYSNKDGGDVSTYFLDCAELDIRREVAGSGTFLLVDGHLSWACTGASTGTIFFSAKNNVSRIHKIYGLAKLY